MSMLKTLLLLTFCSTVVMAAPMSTTSIDNDELSTDPLPPQNQTNFDEVHDLKVVRIQANGPLQKIGLKTGDTFLLADGHSIDPDEELNLLLSLDAGEIRTLHIRRNGQQILIHADQVK